MIKYVLTHWKTTLAGVLIAAGTICSVLTQHGITGGHAGTGTTVGLVAGLSTALLGIIARDPGGS